MTTTQPPAGPELTCSALASATPLAGTAPTTSRWVLVEHDGPWSAHAVRDASTPWLAACAQLPASTARTLLIRPHIHRASQGSLSMPSPASRRIYTFIPGQPTVWTRTVPGDGEPGADQIMESINESIVESIAQGPEHPAWQPASQFPRALVCTNGRRDRCCAQRGRALLDELPDELLHQVWECTHLGGHRFAPTGLAIPSGVVLGRLSRAALLHAITRDSVDLDQMRGRSDLTAAQQVAEIHARRLWGLTSTRSHLHVTQAPGKDLERRSVITVSRDEGADLHVEVEGVEQPGILASCQAEPTSTIQWRIRG